MQLSQFRKKVSWVAMIMVLQRTPFHPWAKNAVLFAGSMIDKVWTWKVALPVAATAGGWHSLSGATSYVSSTQSNSATVREGESYSFKFRTTGYPALSYEVVGLPSGLSYNGSYASPTISGTPDTPGTYTIGITGFRKAGQNGNYTATYYLTLNVKENEVLDTNGDGTGDNASSADEGETSQSAMVIWSDSNTTDLGSGWFQSSWFGNFYGNSGGWTYHLKHEWIYLAETSNGGLWIYDDSLGWLYTEKGVYPYLHRNSNGHWLYDLSTISERKFWDATLETEITP